MPSLQVKDCPADVYQALKECAARENRSISQQTVTVLQAYLGLREQKTFNEEDTNQIAAMGSSVASAQQELSHVRALKRIAQLPPVFLSGDCPEPSQLLYQVREEDAR